MTSITTPAAIRRFIDATNRGYSDAVVVAFTGGQLRDDLIARVKIG